MKWSTSSLTLYEHISFPERVTLLPVADTLAKVYITTLGQSMCQHLHTFTQQVSATASYVLFCFFYLVNIWKHEPKGADGQPVGCPTALQVSVHAKRWVTQQVLIPRHLPGPPPSSYIHSLGCSNANLKPSTVMIRGDQLSVVCNPKALDIFLKRY